MEKVTDKGEDSVRETIQVIPALKKQAIRSEFRSELRRARLHWEK